MEKTIMDKPIRKSHLDTITLSILLLLAGVGLSTLLSASYLRADLYESGPYYFFVSQAKKLGLGALIILFLYFMPTRVWSAGALAVTAVSLVLLILAFVPGFKVEIMGTARWIKIFGFKFQPSEAAKIGVIVYMAYSLSRKGELARGFYYGFLPHVSVLALFGLLIVLGKDLGGAIVIAGIILALSYVSGLRKFYLALIGGVLASGVWYFVVNYGYRMSRIMGWLDPEADPQGAGYPILHSFFAFANGGVTGLGPGGGMEKQFFIPEIHTDYIFTVVGEEMGLVGVIFVCGLFLALIIRGLMIARSATSLFDFYLATGAVMVIGIPAFINMGVALSIWPAKGLALPFFSYGGSNLLVSCCAAGILLQVAAQGRREGEREGEGPILGKKAKSLSAPIGAEPALQNTLSPVLTKPD
jgi:cell division protein FtsW